MKNVKYSRILSISAAGISGFLLSGCASDDYRGASVSASSPTVYSSSGQYPVQTADPNMPISQKRMDITDTGPGTPRGDEMAADPSETSSQGAGSRALVGTQGDQHTSATLDTVREEQSQAQPAASRTYQQTESFEAANYNQGAVTTAQDNIAIPLYREDVQVGKRVVDAGTVRLRKTVRTETVNQPIELRHETVTIDREPASGSSAGQSFATQSGQPFQEQEITIQLQREEPVVQKQVVPSGQIVARKQAQTEQRNIQEQIRREEIAVDRGNTQNVRVSPRISSFAGGSSSAGGQSSGAGASSDAITDLSLLSSRDNATSLAGRQVNLTGARVQAMVDPHLIAIGQQDGRPVYVRLRQPVSDLKEGSMVTIRGLVRQASQAASDAASELSGEAAHILSSQPVFIDAQSVELQNR